MSLVVKHCDDLLEKHHRIVSPVVLSVFAVAIMGFVAPSMLLAAELSAITSTPQGSNLPQEFRPERRYDFGTTSSTRAWPASSTIGQLEREKGEAMKAATQAFRNKRVATMKEKLLQIEQAARDLRLKLEELQASNPSSTPQIAIESINKELNDLLQVFRKTNFVNEVPKLKAEVKKEYELRKQIMKKELEWQRESAKKQMEAERESAKQQFESQRELLKQQEEARREAAKKQAESDHEWVPVTPSTSPSPSSSP